MMNIHYLYLTVRQLSVMILVESCSDPMPQFQYYY